MPHAFCYLEKPALVWTHVVADGVIGFSYLMISLCLAYLVYQGRRDIPFRWMFLAFGLFIVACGGTHFVEAVTVWVPVYVFSAGVKIFTALASVCAAVALPFTVPQALSLIREARESGKRREALEVVLEERDHAQAALQESYRELEKQVKARTTELIRANVKLKTELDERHKLESSIARLAAIMESSEDAIVGKDLRGIITSWNRGAEELYGYKASEVIGSHLSIIVPSERQGEMDEILAKLARGQHIERYETERITKSGAVVQVSLTVSAVFDTDGRIVGASSIARDVTASKRAEEALRESEENYRILFDRNPLPMWIFDRKSLRFLAVNEAAVQHYGYSREEFFRMTILDIRPETERGAILREIENPLGKLENKNVWTHRKKDGSRIEVEITACGLNVPRPDSVLVLAHDVTDRLRNERKLRQSEERFSKAFRSSPLGITISTEADGRYVDANSAFLAFMGFEREELVGRTVEELRIWSEPGDRQLMVLQLDASKPAKPLEVSFRTHSGKNRVVELSAERILLDDEACVLAITQDVTDAKQMQQQLLQAQKMEAVGRLAGGIAHDFNNMLGVIIGYSEIAKERLKPEEAAQKPIAEIRKAAERSAGLVKQLLAFSLQQRQIPRVLDLNSVIANLSTMLTHMVGEDVSLVFHRGESLGSVRVDLGQMEQVLMNLAINARDAMPKGGKLIIETSNVLLDQQYMAAHGPVNPGSYVVMTVSDTGEGMDPETLARIFEPFFTTKEPGRGTGLGLSTVWGIVKQSDGYISVYSDPGRGTTLKIYLPRVDQPAERLIPERIDLMPRSGHETVLVVEDDPGLRALAVSILQMRGYNVLSAANGPTAIELSRQFRGEIALLLTDVIMPGMAGPDVVSEIRNRRPGIKVLYMSGYARNLIFQEGVIDMDTAVLTKPFSSLELLTKVRSMLEGT